MAKLPSTSIGLWFQPKGETGAPAGLFIFLPPKDHWLPLSLQQPTVSCPWFSGSGCKAQYVWQPLWEAPGFCCYAVVYYLGLSHSKILHTQLPCACEMWTTVVCRQYFKKALLVNTPQFLTPWQSCELAVLLQSGEATWWWGIYSFVSPCKQCFN